MIVMIIKIYVVHTLARKILFYTHKSTYVTSSMLFSGNNGHYTYEKRNRDIFTYEHTLRVSGRNRATERRTRETKPEETVRVTDDT